MPAVVTVCLIVLFAIAAPARQTPAEQQGSAQQATAQQPPAQPFPADAIKPESVRAGAMSGGFFHATIAALAMNDPKLLASRIEKSGGDYIVHFADGRFVQRVSAAGVETVRHSGFDRSDDPWVVALYRAYEMRLLWEVIHFSIGHLNFSPNIKVKAAEMMDKNEWLVKA